MMFTAEIAWLASIPWKYLGSLAVLGSVGVAGLVQSSRAGRLRRCFAHLFGGPKSDGTNPTRLPLWAFGCSGGLGGSSLGTGAEKWPGNLAEAQPVRLRRCGRRAGATGLPSWWWECSASSGEVSSRFAGIIQVRLLASWWVALGSGWWVKLWPT